MGASLARLVAEPRGGGGGAGTSWGGEGGVGWIFGGGQGGGEGGGGGSFRDSRLSRVVSSLPRQLNSNSDIDIKMLFFKVDSP